MKNNGVRTWGFYAVLLLVFCLIAYFLIKKGETLDSLLAESGSLKAISRQNSESFSVFKENIFHNLAEPAAMLLLQLISILAVSRLLGKIFGRIGQPLVLAEIIAGIVLGPSLLGKLFPDAFNFIFNPASLGNLYMLSQIGLILFMFTIGMDLDINDLKKKFRDTFIISQTSIIFPFLLGMILAYFYYTEFATGHGNYLSFALFFGISMSITAFPVLARIVQERGMSKTHLGTIAIASAANNDVFAWILLVGVIAIAKTGSFLSSIYTLGASAAYILFMLAVIKPFLKKIGDIYQNEELINKSIFGFFILILIISAYFTQLIGIHALFGAFLAGVVMPTAPKFRKLMIDKIEDISVSLLLPLFFVYTGLKTEIGLVNTPHLWWMTAIIVSVAIFGKIAGSAIPAKVIGENWKNSLSLGVLMNTRGLMELIVLNIGLEMGIIPPTMFVILVIMALVTTFMTAPILSLIEKIFPEKKTHEEIIRQKAEGIFKVLIAVGNPANGANLLRVAKTVLDGAKNTLAVNVMHITAGTETHPIYSEQFEEDSFVEASEEAEKLQVPITTEYRVSDNVEYDIIRNVNQENYDFLLVGAGKAIINATFFNENSVFSRMKWFTKIINKLTHQNTFLYPGTLIKDKTKYFIEQSKSSVGIFYNRNFAEITSTLVVLHDEGDEFLIRYVRRVLRNNPAVTVQIIDTNRILEKVSGMKEAFNTLASIFGSRLKMSKLTKLHSGNISRFSFMMLSYPAWEKLLEEENPALKDIPSTLIINKKRSRFTLPAEAVFSQTIDAEGVEE